MIIKRVMCVPCAEALKAADTHKVECEHGRKVKDTCFKCRKRRYCYTYRVEKYASGIRLWPIKPQTKS